MSCNNYECEYCNTESYEFSELCVRCALKDEMKECRTCKINNDKLKKANDIFPDPIVDLINSFNACKRCIKTIDIMKNEPKNMNNAELNLWYFVKLNPLPSRTNLNKQLDLKDYIYRCCSGNWLCDLNFYHRYHDWFNELWIPKTFKRETKFQMMNILEIMFIINGKKYKLEYPKIFDEEFFKNNVYHYIDKHTSIR